MKRILLSGLAALLAVALGGSVAHPHGGVIPVPPTDGGGGGGSPPVSAPGAPAAPAPPKGPSGTASTPTPSSSGPATGAGGGSRGSPSTPSMSAQDLADWQLWWTFHRDEFIQLKSALARSANTLTGDEAVLGTRTDRGAQLPDPKKVREVVVPALLATLPGERNADVLTAVLLALGKIGRGLGGDEGARIENAIRPYLADPVQEVGETAALALGLLATPSVAPLLAELAGDTERGRALVKQAETPYRTRAFACYALGVLGMHESNPDVRRFVVHHLEQTFEADRSAARDVKTAALVGISLVPLPTLATGPAAGGPKSKAGAVDAAPGSGAADLDWLLGVWKDKKQSELVRAFAATAAARLISVSSAVPESASNAWKDALCDTLRPGSSDPAVLAQSAALALGMIGDNDDDASDARIRETLQRAARDGEALARRFALISLARCGARDGRGEHAKENVAGTRHFLLAQLEGAATPMRPWCALAVGVGEALRIRAGHEPAPEAQAALLRGLKDRRGPNEAGAWCLAAALSQKLDARDGLLGWALDNQDSEARAHAALALGILGWDGAVISLRKVMNDSRYRPLVLRDASIALGLLGSSEAVSGLVSMLSESQSLSAQAAIASALSYVGDARALDPLLALLVKRDRPDRVRAFAAASLGGVCDRDPLPWNSYIGSSVDYWIPPATLFEPFSGTGILDLL